MLYAKDYREWARRKLKGRWGIAILVAFLAGLLGAQSFYTNTNSSSSNLHGSTAANGALSGSDALEQQMNSLSSTIGVPPEVLTALTVVTVILFFVVGSCVVLGENRFFLGLGEGVEESEVGTLFKYFNIIGKAIGLRLFMTLFVFLWSLLLIVPGVIAAIRYSQATYYMCENPDLGIRQAMDMSKETMKGRCGRFFCMNLSFIGWAFLCCFTFGIGYLWLNPYMNAANAAFHIDLVRDQNAQQAAPTPVTPMQAQV